MADEIYRFCWGPSIRILRPGDRQWPEAGEILDLQLATDVLVRLSNGLILTGQEKFLSQEYATFRTITVAYRNQLTGNELSWFHIAAQFYFVGYEAPTGFEPWVLLNWPSVVLATLDRRIAWKEQRNYDPRYTAGFMFVEMAGIPADCIIACSWDPYNSVLKKGMGI